MDCFLKIFVGFVDRKGVKDYMMLLDTLKHSLKCSRSELDLMLGWYMAAHSQDFLVCYSSDFYNVCQGFFFF